LGADGASLLAGDDRALRKRGRTCGGDRDRQGIAHAPGSRARRRAAPAHEPGGVSTSRNPFKPFGAPSPTALQGLGYAEEAKQILVLESAVLKRKGLSKASIDAAKAAGKAARGVQAELAAIPKLEKARTAAMPRRDALAQAWETAFAGLKRAARAAEDDGAKGLHGALFGRAKASPKPKKKAPEPK